MDQHSIKENSFISFISFISFLFLFMTGVFFSSLVTFDEAIAKKQIQVAQSNENDEEGEEDDEDC